MNRPRHILSIYSFFTLLLLGTLPLFGQPDAKSQIEPNYEVILHVVIGTNDAQSGALPQSLSKVSKQLKANFAFSGYRLANTYLGRIANTGNLEYKTVSNIFGQEQENESPSFLDWSLNSMKSGTNERGQAEFQFQSFRFGTRIPVKTSSMNNESGKTSYVINYEHVGLSLTKISLPENTPTLIGSLSLPKTTGTVFLVMTLRPL